MNKSLQFHIGCLGHFSYKTILKENLSTYHHHYHLKKQLNCKFKLQDNDIIQKCNEINKQDVKTLIYDYCKCTKQRPNITLETWEKRKIYEIKRPTMPFPKIKIKNLSHAYCKIYNEKSV